MSDIQSYPEKHKDLDRGVKVVIAATEHGEEALEDSKQHIAEESEFTEEEYKRLLRKIDLFLLPVFMFTYGMQFTDKQSLASSVVFGLPEDTHLVGNEYANLSTFFYMSYAVAQFPMSWLLQRFPLGRALSVCIIIWGGIVMCLGAANNYAQLAALRVLLGIFECVITPGFAIMTSSWYLRREQTLRQNAYYSMNTMFSIISGVLIYLLAKRAEADGKIAAWRVINLFLGALTVFTGIVNLIFLGTPQEVWWLTKREKAMAHARIVSNATGGGEQHPWKWYQVRECFCDPQYYFLIFFNIFCTIPNGAILTFVNLIMKSFGFNSFEAIIYGLPGLAIAFCFVIGPAIITHRWPKVRFFIAIATMLLCVVSFFVTGFLPITTDKWTKWSVFLFAQIFAGPMFLIWPLMTVNVGGRTKKAWLAATSMVSICIGNIIGSQTFRPSDAPRYTKGIIVCGCVMLANCFLMLAWRVYYIRANRKRELAFADSGLTAEEQDYQRKLAGEEDMTDVENVHFRYTY